MSEEPNYLDADVVRARARKAAFDWFKSGSSILDDVQSEAWTQADRHSYCNGLGKPRENARAIFCGEFTAEYLKLKGEEPRAAMPFYNAPYVSPMSTLGTNGHKFALVALPRAAWRAIKGGCGCKYCSETPTKSGEAFYDALCFDLTELEAGVDVRAHYVHAPELHSSVTLRP